MHAFRIKLTDGIRVSGKMAKGGAGDDLETLDGAHSLLKLDRFGEHGLSALAVDKIVALVCLPSQAKLGREFSLQRLRDTKQIPCRAAFQFEFDLLDAACAPGRDDPAVINGKF